MEIKTLNAGTEKKIDKFLSGISTRGYYNKMILCAEPITKTEDHVLYKTIGYNICIHQADHWTSSPEILCDVESYADSDDDKGIAFFERNTRMVLDTEDVKKLIINFLQENL